MVKRGMSRMVLLIGPWAIKVPSGHNGLRLWVNGWLANLLETERWRSVEHTRSAVFFAPVYVSLAGLLIVMRRETPVQRRLTATECDMLPIANLDNNGHNIGMRGGHLVVFDYGGAENYVEIRL